MPPCSLAAALAVSLVAAAAAAADDPRHPTPDLRIVDAWEAGGAADVPPLPPPAAPASPSSSSSAAANAILPHPIDASTSAASRLTTDGGAALPSVGRLPPAAVAAGVPPLERALCAAVGMAGCLLALALRLTPVPSAWGERWDPVPPAHVRRALERAAWRVARGVSGAGGGSANARAAARAGARALLQLRHRAIAVPAPGSARAPGAAAHAPPAGSAVLLSPASHWRAVARAAGDAVFVAASRAAAGLPLGGADDDDVPAGRAPTLLEAEPHTATDGGDALVTLIAVGALNLQQMRAAGAGAGGATIPPRR